MFTIAALAISAALISTSPAAAARSWRAPLEVERSGSFNRAAMTQTSNGEIVVAWPEGSSLKVRVRLANGAGLSPAQIIGGDVESVSAAPIANGGAVVAWSGTTTPGVDSNNVLVSEYTPGAGFSAPQAVGSGWSPAVAADASGNAAVFFRNGTELSRVRRSTGGVWGAPAQVSPATGSQLRVGMSAAGEAIYTWVGGGSAIHASFESAASTPSAPQTVTPGGMQGNSPGLDVNASGAAVLTFVQAGENDFLGRVRGAIRPAGGSFGSPTELGGWAGPPPMGGAVGVALSDDGHIATAWQDNREPVGNGSQLLGIAATMGTVGGGFGPRELVVRDAGFSRPLVSIDPLGNAAFFYGEYQHAYAVVSRRPVAGGFEGPNPVVPCPGPSGYVNAAVLDPSGNAALLWQQTNRMDGSTIATFLSEDEPSAQTSPASCGTYTPPPQGGFGGPGTGTTVPPTTTPARPTFALAGPRSVKMKALLKSGLPVSVKASAATKVRTRLYLLKGKKRILADTETVSAKANKKLAVSLKPSKSVARQIKKLRRGKLVVESTPLGTGFSGKAATRTVTIKR